MLGLLLGDSEGLCSAICRYPRVYGTVWLKSGLTGREDNSETYCQKQ
jgi:hypothetical protein